MDYLIDLKKQNLSGKVALEGGISLGVDTDGNIKKIDESGAISDIGGSVDESRLLPTGGKNGDIPVYDATVTGGGIDEYTQACFHFDETDGSFKNAVDGSAEYLESTATYSAQGKFDGAAEFSGSQRIKYSKTTALNWGTDQGTVDGWFYPNGIQNKSNALIATPGGWSSGGISIGYDRSNTRKKFSVWMKEASGDMAWSSTEEYPRNAWYHWALVRSSATELLFFVNGKKIGTIEIGSDREIDWSNGDGYCTIGYNEADSNAGVIGRMDEVRFSNTARWTEDFTPPAVPYSEQVAEGRWGKMSSSGLVSIAAPANGDIPCFDATATIGGGNDANTKLLIQPETGNNQILDQAAGNAAPVGITNSGNVAIAANALVFSGENALIIEPNTLGMTLGGNNEYSIEVDFQLDQVKNDWATLFGGDGSMTRSAFYINSSGATAVQGGIAPDTTGWTTGTRHRLTIERFQDGDSWKTVIYRNGAVLATSVTTPNTLSGDRFPIGSNLEGTGRNFVGKIWAFRISNKAEHRGVSFTPRELPWIKPQTVGEWGKLNKSELAMKSDLTTKADKTELLGKADKSQLANYQPLLPVERQLPAAIADDHLIMSEVTTSIIPGANDDTVKFLLQPATSSNQVVDSAAGNTTSLEFTNNGVTADSDGVMTFSPTQYAVIPANTVSTGLIDILLNIPVVPNDDVKYVLFGSGPESNSGDGFYVVLQGGKLYFCPSDRAIMFLGNYTANTWVNITLGYSGPTVNADRNLGYWLDGTGHTVNLNSYGSTDTSGYVYTYSPFGHAFYLGKTDMSSTGLTWKAKVVRLRNTVEAISWYPYNDTTTITVDDYPYQKTVQKVTKSWVRSTIAQLEAKMNVATASAAGLMAAEDKATLTGLTERGIYPELYNVADPIDFNQLTTQGFYFIGGGTDHINYPGTDAKLPGTLTVLRRGNYLTQTFSAIGVIGTSVWERNMYRVNIENAFTITDWHRLISDAEITESKTSPGYFKLPGGTIVQWGNFVVTADPQTQEITLPVALSSAYVRQASGSNSSLKIGIYGGTDGKITCYVEGSTSGTVSWMVIGK